MGNLDRKKTKRTKNIIATTKEKEETNQKEDKEIIKNLVCGLDVSTSVIGITILDIITSKIELFHSINLLKEKSLADLYDKIDFFTLKFKEIMIQNNLFSNCLHFAVEESPKMFAMGKSTADTIIKLAKFNILVCNSIYQLSGMKPKEINVRSARTKLGIKIDTKDKSKNTKEKVREEVIKMYPDLPLTYHIAKNGKYKGQKVLDKENEDKIDAFVICKSASLML